MLFWFQLACCVIKSTGIAFCGFPLEMSTAHKEIVSGGVIHWDAFISVEPQKQISWMPPNPHTFVTWLLNCSLLDSGCYLGLCINVLPPPAVLRDHKATGLRILSTQYMRWLPKSLNGFELKKKKKPTHWLLKLDCDSGSANRKWLKHGAHSSNQGGKWMNAKSLPFVVGFISWHTPRVSFSGHELPFETWKCIWMNSPFKM